MPVLARPLPTGATEERARVRRGWEHKARSRRNHETGLSGWQTKRGSTRNSSAPDASQPKQISSLEFDKSSKGGKCEEGGGVKIHLMPSQLDHSHCGTLELGDTLRVKAVVFCNMLYKKKKMKMMMMKKK